jgi:hypothetical protein
MTTAGLDFFDQDFFQDQVVVLCKFPISKMKWYSAINDQLINKWKLENTVSVQDEIIARRMLTNFSADILTLPFVGDNKVRHYFEKVLWLIQSYCRENWKNPLKGINHLDNGTIVIHPGTNRCVAAKFLGCDELSVLININKSQQLLTLIPNTQVITDEITLRNTLSSNGPILWRTESQEELWVNGVRQRGIYYKDFTYEFLGADAWPGNSLPAWIENIFNFLPLTVYIESEVETANVDKLSKQLQHSTFKSITTPVIEIPLTYNFITVSSFDDIKDNGNYIFISNIANFKKNIFELLYFVNPECSISRTADSSIFIRNAFSSSNNELIIPDHYVNC